MASRGLNVTVQGLEKLGADLDDVARRLPLAIRASLRGAGGTAIESELKARAPRKSGKLVAGIHIRDKGSGGVMIGYANADDQRGVWVESGTKPHLIRAEKHKSLFFLGHNVEAVHHPGAKGQRVAARAIRAVEWEVMSDIVDKLEEIT